jgi:uncharacterized protein YgiM (DUF1202 family)
MKYAVAAPFTLVMLLSLTWAIAPAHAGRCNYPDDLDASGHRCGGRASSVRPGGYEPPPESSSSPSSSGLRSNEGQNAVAQEDWIQGPGFTGYCSAKIDVNLRSGPQLSSNVIGNTGSSRPTATVHTTQFHNGGLWAWTTIDGKDAWVRADTLENCH